MIDMKCTNNITTITWPTDLHLSPTQLSLPQKVERSINSKMEDTGTAILDLVVYTDVPT